MNQKLIFLFALTTAINLCLFVIKKNKSEPISVPILVNPIVTPPPVTPPVTPPVVPPVDRKSTRLNSSHT